MTQPNDASPGPDGVLDSQAQAVGKPPYSRLMTAIKARKWAIMYPRVYKSQNVNVFHCTTQKAGSQWIRAIFADKRVYKYSGLIPFDYEAALPNGLDSNKINRRSIRCVFPRQTIATPLYIDYNCYKQIPKRRQAKAIFVIRDPRDLVVSEYFSIRYSHRPIGDIPAMREHLNAVSEKEGLVYTFDFLEDYGIFACQNSWIEATATNSEVRLVRFEDLIGPDRLSHWNDIFIHFDIRIPQDILSRLLNDHSFETISGRRRGTEDQKSHYRKGIHGDWRNYFDDSLVNRFKERTGDLLVRLGYELNEAWT